LAQVQAFQVGEPTEAQKKTLDRNYKTILGKIKGPYTPNFCVCDDGRKLPVLGKEGSVANRCGEAGTRFCSAFRAEWAEALAGEGMYVGNIFAPDLYDWDRIPDHHNLVRGYILEQFFVDTHPEHKLAEMKAYGGLSGAAYEARDPAGNPRAWDIELGFSKGKLWLFQVRPFIGNEDMRNVPALSALESGSSTASGTVSLKEAVR
jgi:hypothetical protein